MYSFKDDYSETGHEKILSDLLKISRTQFDGYGLDSISEDAKNFIRQRFALDKNDADIHFISGGTQTNKILTHCALSSIEAVIAADTGHICVHETGAVESNGNKICVIPNKDGKLIPSDIEKIYYAHTDEHMVKPKLVYISQATEIGTVYKKQELENLYKTCKKLNLYLFIDGARLGAALASNGMDIKPQDMANLCDAFYIGGTKNGSPLGEALCIINKKLNENFRYYLKQDGALLAKGALIGSCFKTLFTDDLFFDLAKHSTAAAQKMKKALVEKGYRMYSDSPVNMIFPVLPNEIIARLQKDYKFHVWEKVDDSHSVIRLVCSWATSDEEIDKFIAAIF
ncbi:MAG: aminotransferase class V-fold PLP-dependent enzyme [Treponema sp.]|nr:aminotransferase class V-fold PLP-dependent enzyme [Treponema sp.]MCL2245352.1 aminotransferase class V-fold PLP-dependent enzyme [Treponema sp.]